MITRTGGADYGMADAFQRHPGFLSPLRHLPRRLLGKAIRRSKQEEPVDLGVSACRASDLVQAPNPPILPQPPRLTEVQTPQGAPPERRLVGGGASFGLEAASAAERADVLARTAHEAAANAATETSASQTVEGMAMSAMWLTPPTGLHPPQADHPVRVDQDGLSLGNLALDVGGLAVGDAYVGDDYLSYFASRSGAWAGADWRLGGAIFGGRDYLGAGLATDRRPLGGQTTASARLVVSLGGDWVLADAGPAEEADREILAAAFGEPPRNIQPEQVRWLEVTKTCDRSIAPRFGAFFGVGANARVAHVKTTDQVLRFAVHADEARALLQPTRNDGKPCDLRRIGSAAKRWVATKLDAWDLRSNRIDIPSLDDVREKLQVGQQLTVSRRGSLRLGAALGGLPATSLRNELLSVGFVGANVRLNGEFYLSARRVDEDHVDVVWIPAHARAYGVSLSMPLCAQVSARSFSAESLMQSFRLDLSTTEGRRWYSKICAGQFPDDIDKAVADVPSDATPEVAAARILRAANEHLPAGVERRLLRLARPTVSSVGGGYVNWVFPSGINAYRTSHHIDNVTTDGTVGLCTREIRTGTQQARLRRGTQEQGTYAQTRRLALLDTADQVRMQGLDGVTVGAYFVDVARGREGHDPRQILQVLHAFGIFLANEASAPKGSEEEALVGRHLSLADMRVLARYGQGLRDEDTESERAAREPLGQICQWLAAQQTRDAAREKTGDDAPPTDTHHGPCRTGNEQRLAERLAKRLRELLIRLAETGCAAEQPSAEAYGRGAQALLELADAEGLTAMAALHWLLGGRPEDVVVKLRSPALLEPVDNAHRVAFAHAEPLVVPAQPSEAALDAVVSRFAEVREALDALGTAREDLASTPFVPERDRQRKDRVLDDSEQQLRSVLTPASEADRRNLLELLRERLRHARRNRAQLQGICDCLDTDDATTQTARREPDPIEARHPGGLPGLLGRPPSTQAVSDAHALYRDLSEATSRVQKQRASVRDNRWLDPDRRAEMLAQLDAASERLHQLNDLGARNDALQPLVCDAALGQWLNAVDLFSPLFASLMEEAGRRRASSRTSVGHCAPKALHAAPP